MARSTSGRSPPGSMTTARFVASHHSRVQFCWKGVTRMMMVLALVMVCAHRNGKIWLGGSSLGTRLISRIWLLCLAYPVCHAWIYAAKLASLYVRLDGAA